MLRERPPPLFLQKQKVRETQGRAHLDDCMGSSRGARVAGNLGKRCSDTMDRVSDIFLLHDALHRRLLERHGVDPAAWCRCRDAAEATSTLQ